MKSLKEYMTNVNEGMESDDVMAIMAKHPEEVAKMKQMGDIDSRSDLYMELYNYYSDEMPYGTQKARDGDPIEWIMTRLDDLGLAESQEVNEDSVDSMKQAKLNDMFLALERLNDEYDELEQMDREQTSSGVGDLTDQLATMGKLISGLFQVLDRSSKIVPEESKEPTGSNPNMEGSRMGNMHIQNLRKNAGLDYDPVKLAGVEEDVDQQYKDVMATRNDIKINRFLAKQPEDVAKRLTGTKAQPKIKAPRPGAYSHSTNPEFRKSGM